jgi:hypothetical protein
VDISLKLELAVNDLCKTAEDVSLYEVLSMLNGDTELEAELREIVLAEMYRRNLAV